MIFLGFSSQMTWLSYFERGKLRLDKKPAAAYYIDIDDAERISFLIEIVSFYISNIWLFWF